MSAITVMIVDDDPGIRFAFGRTFAALDCEVIEAASGPRALSVLEGEIPDIVYLDVAMPLMDGLTVLDEIKRRAPDLPVVIITGEGDMQTAIQAMRKGAFDYLTKPLDVTEIRDVFRRALDCRADDATDGAVDLGAEPAGGRRGQIVGRHASIQQVFKKIGMISTTPPATNVMILGETGTGKELVARAIHDSGSTAEAPFQAINCVALPENLMESELFGHEKGAFTGADRMQPGKFELAGQGTVFLDEIGDMPLNLQTKLLRVIQERVFERVGGHHQIPLAARIIAATNRDLKAAVARGEFREDLFYRLNVMEIELPPLRERGDDLTLLVDHFVARFNTLFGKNIASVSAEAMAVLRNHSFPGNVRELENMIERAVILERGRILTPKSLPLSLSGSTGPGPSDEVPANLTFAEAKQALISDFESDYLAGLISRHGGNVSAAAREAGLERQSLHRLLTKYGIDPGDHRSRADGPPQRKGPDDE